MSPWFPVLAALLAAVAFAVAFMRMSGVLGPHRATRTKRSVYECGMPPVGDTHQRFSVKFYLVAVLFIVFDLEAVLLYPFAAAFKDLVGLGSGAVALAEMGIFLGGMFVGWIYVLRRGALDWSRAPSSGDRP